MGMRKTEMNPEGSANRERNTEYPGTNCWESLKITKSLRNRMNNLQRRRPIWDATEGSFEFGESVWRTGSERFERAEDSKEVDDKRRGDAPRLK